MNGDPGTITDVPPDRVGQAQPPIEVDASAADGPAEPAEAAEPQVGAAPRSPSRIVCFAGIDVHDDAVGRAAVIWMVWVAPVDPASAVL